MNTRNLLIASAIGAVVTTVLVSIPGLNVVLICALCLPLWGGPLLAAWYYKRETGVMTMNHAISVGALTGLLAAVLGFIVGLVLGPVTTAAVTNLLQQYAPAGSAPIVPTNTAPTVGGLLFGILMNVVFGVIGGLIGGAIFKDKVTPPAPPAPPIA